jgi:cobalamin biosynthesis protein CobC
MSERAIVHGGDLDWARRHFPDAPEPWVGLSTGINPIAYPLPPLEPELWSRLPQVSDLRELERAAARAYRAAPGAEIVAAPGTQALIQWLPRLFPAKRVAIRETSYREHEANWRAAGAAVENVDKLDGLAGSGAAVLVNPNNPDGRLVSPADLKPLADRFAAAAGGLLVIDEAFMDATPDQSFASHLPRRGVVILRSFGKIYGLAGVRLGFAIAGTEVAHMLRRALGPWPVSGPGIRIGSLALQDQHWLTRTRERLLRDAARLDALLAQAGFDVIGGTPLFRLARHADAPAWYARLGRAGILVRRFDERLNDLRFGLPGDDGAWNRLEEALLISDDQVQQRDASRIR